MIFNPRKDVNLHVVHPNELKWIHQSSKKTDKVDAKKMAELARIDGLPRKVHVVEGSIRDLRELISARETLMCKRVSLINAIRGFMKQEGIKLPVKFFQSKDWTEKLEKVKVGKVQKIIIENYMYALEHMQLAEEGLLTEIYKIEDPRIELIESIPSMGPLSSRVILSALDDVKRFDDKKAVAKYGALTPKIYQSGNVTQLGRIGNDGRRELRRVLLQCSHTINRMSKNHAAKPLYNFSQKIAAVATSRKLLTVAYGVLKNGEFYDPENLKPHKAA
jgi:transposase